MLNCLVKSYLCKERSRISIKSQKSICTPRQPFPITCIGILNWMVILNGTYQNFIKIITIITIYKQRSSLFCSSPRQLYHCVSGPRRPWPSGKSCDLLGWCIWFQDDLYEVRGHQGGQRRNCESRENHLWSSSCQGTVLPIGIFLCFLTCQRFK